MKVKRIVLITFTFFLIFSLSACNFPVGNQNNNESVNSTLIALAVAQTAFAQTVNSPNTQPQQGVTTEPNVVAPQATFTNTIEPTITLTPTITVTSTPEGVFLTLSKDTNCRIGPLAIFPAVTTVRTGLRVKVMGQNPDRDTYYVENPNAPGNYCWVWGKYATLEGNQSGLPIFTPQPTPTATATPTPAAVFSLSYISLENCNVNYSLKFFVRNTGSVIWQSVQSTMYDASTGFTGTQTSNTFSEFTGCNPTLEQGDLTPGEESYVVNIVNDSYFKYNPAGHAITYTIKLCSQDGLAGTCSTQTMTVTP